MANFFMVPGGGLEFGGGAPVLNEVSLARAERLVQLFDENPRLFSAAGSLVVCAGNHPTLPEGIPEPDEDHREGTLMADYLLSRGISHRLVEPEITSTSTFTNIEHTVSRIGFDNISPDSPLHVVSHPHHAQRAIFCARKLGIIKQALVAVPTLEKDSVAYEFGMRTITRAAMVLAHDPKTLYERDQMLERTHDKLAGYASRAKKVGKKVLHTA